MDYLDHLDHLVLQVRLGHAVQRASVGHQAKVAKVIKVIGGLLDQWVHRVHPVRGSKAILDHEDEKGHRDHTDYLA